MSSTLNPEEFLTIEEVAAEVRMGRAIVREAARTGELRAARIGKRQYRVMRKWMAAWIEQRVAVTPIGSTPTMQEQHISA